MSDSISYSQQVSLMPQSIQDKMAMAKYLSASGLMPQGLKTPEQVFVSLQWGHELGLSPMVAINNIAVINGKPTLSTDIMHALVRDNPEYGGAVWEVQNEKEARVRITRISKGVKESFVGHYSIYMAERAKLTGKDTWQKYPERMIKHRALSFALRDSFPDVLAGIYTPDEMHEADMRNVTPLNAGDRDTDATPDYPPLPPPNDERKQQRQHIINEIGTILGCLDPSNIPYFLEAEKEAVRRFVKETGIHEQGIRLLKEKQRELSEALDTRILAGTDSRHTDKAEPENPSSPPAEALLRQREKTIEEIEKIINYLNPEALPFFSEEERAAEEAFMKNVGLHEQGLKLLNERKVQLAVKLDERIQQFKPEFPWEPKEEEPATLMENSVGNKPAIGKPADGLFFGNKPETAKVAVMAG